MTTCMFFHNTRNFFLFMIFFVLPLWQKHKRPNISNLLDTIWLKIHEEPYNYFPLGMQKSFRMYEAEKFRYEKSSVWDSSNQLIEFYNRLNGIIAGIVVLVVSRAARVLGQGGHQRLWLHRQAGRGRLVHLELQAKAGCHFICLCPDGLRNLMDEEWVLKHKKTGTMTKVGTMIPSQRWWTSSSTSSQSWHRTWTVV